MQLGTMIFEELESKVDESLPSMISMPVATQVCYPGWSNKFYPSADFQFLFIALRPKLQNRLQLTIYLLELIFCHTFSHG